MATLREDALIVLGIGAAVLVIAWYAKNRAVKVAETVAPYIDPTSDTNIAYQGASSLARWLAGQETGDLGTIVWDYVHKAEPAPGGGGLINYTPEQQAADERAIRQLEAGYHGM